MYGDTSVLVEKGLTLICSCGWTQIMCSCSVLSFSCHRLYAETKDDIRRDCAFHTRSLHGVATLWCSWFLIRKDSTNLKQAQYGHAYGLLFFLQARIHNWYTYAYICSSENRADLFSCACLSKLAIARCAGTCANH